MYVSVVFACSFSVCIRCMYISMCIMTKIQGRCWYIQDLFCSRSRSGYTGREAYHTATTDGLYSIKRWILWLLDDAMQDYILIHQCSPSLMYGSHLLYTWLMYVMSIQVGSGVDSSSSFMLFSYSCVHLPIGFHWFMWSDITDDQNALIVLFSSFHTLFIDVSIKNRGCWNTCSNYSSLVCMLCKDTVIIVDGIIARGKNVRSKTKNFIGNQAIEEKTSSR